MSQCPSNKPHSSQVVKMTVELVGRGRLLHEYLSLCVSYCPKYIPLKMGHTICPKQDWNLEFWNLNKMRGPHTIWFPWHGWFPNAAHHPNCPLCFAPLPRGRAVSHHDNHFSCLWKHDQHSQCIPWTLLSVSCAHLTFQATDHAVGKRQHTNIGTQTDIDTHRQGHRGTGTQRLRDREKQRLAGT